MKKKLTLGADWMKHLMQKINCVLKKNNFNNKIKSGLLWVHLCAGICFEDFTEILLELSLKSDWILPFGKVFNASSDTLYYLHYYKELDTFMNDKWAIYSTSFYHEIALCLFHQLIVKCIQNQMLPVSMCQVQML